MPVEVGMPAKKKRRGMTSEEIAALLAKLEDQGEPNVSAVGI